MKTAINTNGAAVHQRIPLADLLVSERNTRHPKPADVSELALSMKEIGQTTPAIVRPYPKKKGAFEIAAGARRFVAAQSNGFDGLDCVVRELDDDSFEELILVENLQRVDPDPKAEIELLDRLVKRGIRTPEQISAHLGKPPHWAIRRLRILKVAPELRKLWALPEDRNNSLAHFSVDMMSLIGSLPNETQVQMIKDWNFRECISRADLQRYINRQVACRLDTAPFDLTDKRFFVRGCGPGCACDSSALSSLFTDDGDKKEPACCLKPSCFMQRLGLAQKAQLDEVTEGKDLPLVSKNGHVRNLQIGDKRVSVRDLEYSGFAILNKEEKGAQKVVVVAKDKLSIGWIKQSRRSSSGRTQPVKSTGARLAERKSILRGKRLHLVHDELLKALDETKDGDCTQDIVDLVTVFGLPYRANSSYGKTRGATEWQRFDKRKTEGFRIDRIGGSYGGPTLMQQLVGAKDREAALWHGLKSVLADVMKPLGNVGDAPNYETDMRRVAGLISFPFDERKKAADLKITPPKSWGPVDVHTLEPVKRKAAAKPAAKKASPKAAKPAKTKRKKK
jgi:ParB/RepB/Spo0J family partition protein